MLSPDDSVTGDGLSLSVGLFGEPAVSTGGTALVGAPGTNLLYSYTLSPSLGVGPTPFDTFDVTQFLAADYILTLKSTFTLGAGSNGIFPLTEKLTVKVGGLTTTIPAGGFTTA